MPPAAAPQPVRPEGYPTLDEAYCTGEPGNGFGNAKECYYLACSLGDGASCDMAASYNGNLWPDGRPPNSTETKRDVPSPRRERVDYGAARVSIVGSDWQPLGGPCQGFMDDETCRRFPEIGNCSGTGRGFCDMNFAKGGHCLVVITTGGPPQGDEPGDTHVEVVFIHAGPCRKDPNSQ
jgi:hypothetical protein